MEFDKKPLERVKFLWVAAMGSAGGLSFTFAYSILIIFILTDRIENIDSYAELILYFVFLPLVAMFIGMTLYHFAYKSFIGKSSLNTDILDKIMTARFKPVRQISGLIAILSGLTLAVSLSIVGIASVSIYYLAVILSISYMITVLAYNSVISYIVLGEIYEENWNNGMADGLFYWLYVKDNHKEDD